MYSNKIGGERKVNYMENYLPYSNRYYIFADSLELFVLFNVSFLFAVFSRGKRGKDV